MIMPAVLMLATCAVAMIYIYFRDVRPSQIAEAEDEAMELLFQYLDDEQFEDTQHFRRVDLITDTLTSYSYWGRYWNLTAFRAKDMYPDLMNRFDLMVLYASLFK